MIGAWVVVFDLRVRHRRTKPLAPNEDALEQDGNWNKSKYRLKLMIKAKQRDVAARLIAHDVHRQGRLLCA